MVSCSDKKLAGWGSAGLALWGTLRARPRGAAHDEGNPVKIITVLASSIDVGDVLTDAEGMYQRTVVAVDTVSNVHGKIILRTGRRGTGFTVVAPGTLLHVVV